MSTYRILVVDDNPNIHKDFRRIVAAVARSAPARGADVLGVESAPPSTSDFEVTCAVSGEDAAALVADASDAGRPFSMAFVDMRMPGWDGLETVEKLWRLQPDLEVAFSSAYMDYSWNDVTQRLRRPGLRFVPKPWTGSQILAVLHELRMRARERVSPIR
jgi:CheY-like chemotaxis protein